MPWCPECGYEYQLDVAVCPECKARLVGEPPANLRRKPRRAGRANLGDTTAEQPDGEPGLWCPQCEAQYRPGVAICPSCGVALVDTIPDRFAYRRQNARAVFRRFLARLRGTPGLPPCFIERFLAGPSTGWHPVLAFLAAFVLAPSEWQPAYLHHILVNVDGAASTEGLQWTLGALGLIYYAFVGFAAGSLEQKRPWLWVLTGILAQWSLGAVAMLRAPEREGVEWLSNPRFVGLAGAYLAAAGAGATFFSPRALRWPVAAGAIIALGLFWTREVALWFSAIGSWLVHPSSSDKVIEVAGILLQGDDLMGVFLAGVGVGWLARRDGWLLGAPIAVLALGRIVALPTLYPSPWGTLILGTVIGAAGGLLGQELVARFVAWRQRSARPWPTVVMGVLISAGLAAFVSLPYEWLAMLMYVVVPISEAPSWASWVTWLMAALLVGLATGHLLARPPRFAAATVAGAWALHYLVFWGVPSVSHALWAVAGMMAAAVGALAATRMFAHIQSRGTQQGEDAQAGEVNA